MTEADKIAHARVYMEKLANGINPLTNQVVPDADLIIVPDTVKWMNRLLEPSLTLVKLIMLPQEFVP